MPSSAAFGRLEQFHLEPGLDVGRAIQRRLLFEKRTEPAGATPTQVSFGPFRLLRAQFLLLEGDEPVPLGRTWLLRRRLSRYLGSRELSATGEAPGNSGEALLWSRQ